jgi:hypothetical protein
MLSLVSAFALQLPLSTLVFMLNRFQPDDFSREGIPYEVLGALRQQAAAAGAADCSQPPRLQVEGECTYYSPTDDMAMEKVRCCGSCMQVGLCCFVSFCCSWCTKCAALAQPASHTSCGSECLQKLSVLTLRLLLCFA